MVRLIPAILCFALLALINAQPSAPRSQTASENYAARHRPCTETHCGWPLPFHFRYSGGYINPDEWLAWDVDPVFSRFDTINFTLDLIVAIALSAIAWLLSFVLHRPDRSNSDAVTACLRFK